MPRAFLVPRDERPLREEGWAYGAADVETDDLEVADPAAEVDDDLVALHATGSHLFDGLDQVEREVVAARFGFDGQPARTMRELQDLTGLPRERLRHALDDGLAKIRTRLASDVV